MAELGVFGVGVATTDPELRHVGENKAAVCSVNVAFNRSYKVAGNDDWKQETCFLKAQVWGSRAERMAELVKKGQPIYMTGYMKQDSWEDKDTGMKRVSHSINLRDFQLCAKNSKTKDNAQTAGATSTKTESTPATIDNEAIPF
jgi:single-strand DNA-binding protein